MKKKLRIIFATIIIVSFLVIEGCGAAYVGVGVYGPSPWGGYGPYGPNVGRIGMPYGW